MVDLGKIVSVVEIKSVRLCEVGCRSIAWPDEIADAVSVKPSHNALVKKEPEDDGLLVIHANFGLEVRSQDDDEELQTEIRATFELSYQIPENQNFSSEMFSAFGQINAVFNAWPYWRELVQSSLGRMSMPVLTVPVFRLPQKDPENDELK
jgi:hypothetical protein